MKRKWTTTLTIGIVIFSLLWPGGLIALPQATDSEQQKKAGASAPRPAGAAAEQNDRANQPSPQAPPEEEFIEVERQTPFGTQRFRIPKSAATAGQGTGNREQGTVAQPVSPPPPGTQIPPAAAAQAAQQPAGGAVPPGPSTPAAPASQAPETATVPIALHLENADMLQVIGIIAAELKMNYVIDPQVKGTVNINTLGELRRGDLFPLLQMILRINGATAVQTGNFFRIVPLREVQRMPLDPLFNPEAASLPSDDRMVMDIIPLRYVSAPDMTKILTPFLSEGGHLFSQDAANILLITDSSRSMKRLLELVAMFDTEVFTNQRTRLYQIKNSQATRVAEDLREIFSAYGLSTGTSSIRFVPIERLNSVLVVTANSSVYPEVEKWLDKLDQAQQQSGVRNFIYQVENAKAADLAAVLTALLVGLPSQPGGPGAARGPGGGATQTIGMATPQTALPAAGFLGATVAGTGAPGTPQIRIVPDAINNLLLIQTTAQEYEQIKQTLKDLDIIPRQVMIEAKVYEVDLTGALSGGVSAFLQNRDNAERKLTAGFGSSQGAGAAALNAAVGTLVGKTRELLLFLNAAETRSQARVISAPSILASNNMSANIDVGTSIPVLTSQALVAGAQVSGSSLFTNTVQNLDTGVLLTITPRINSSGLVSMQINQEVSAPLPPSGGIQSPSIQKRSISTQVVVQDGDTIALGGIIQENRSRSKNRIPLLGDIPYLGAIFGTTSVSSQRTELIILLTPTVIRTISEAQSATAELRDKLRDLRSILEEEEQREKERKKGTGNREQGTEKAPE